MRICIVSITVLFSVPMVAASYAVAATTVTNDVIFTNPARSIHWKTVCSGNLEIPVPNWPDGASSATLSVSGNDFAAKTFTISSPEDSFRLTLALPDTEYLRVNRIPPRLDSSEASETAQRSSACLAERVHGNGSASGAVRRSFPSRRTWRRFRWMESTPRFRRHPDGIGGVDFRGAVTA